MRALLLLGLICLGVPAAAQEVPVVHFSVDRFVVEGANPFDQAATRRILQPFLGRHQGLKDLQAAAAALQKALGDHGYAFRRVVLPPQTLKENTVKLEVIAFKLGTVRVTGNRYFSNANILSSLPALRRGQIPDTRELSRELQLANEQPSKSLDLNMKRGVAPETIDADVRVQDRHPYRFFAALNDIGTEQTGRLRLSVGGQYNNLFNRDQSITFSYTTSPDNASEVMQYGFNYQIPLYDLASSLSFFYTHSDVNTGTVAQFFDVSGSGNFAGATFTHVLLRHGNYRHDWSLSIQDRLFRNNVSFLGTPIGVDVRSRPLSLRYEGAYTVQRYQASFYLAYVHNLPSGTLNNDATYAAAVGRPGATSSWEAVRFGGQLTYFLRRGWALRALLDGQYSPDPLIPGEQFGLGGVNSIRGFEERALTGDSALRGSAEIWTPVLLYNVRALVFFDAGHAFLNDTLPGTVSGDTIASTGFGLRWQWKDQINVMLDYGRVVEHANPTVALDTGNVKWNFDIVYRF